MKNFVLSATPLAVLIVGTGWILGQVLAFGQVVVGTSILFGNYDLTLGDLPQLRDPVLPGGAEVRLSSASPMLRYLCAASYVLEAIMIALVTLALYSIALHLGDPVERGQVMAQRWRRLSIVVLVSPFVVGISTTLTWWILGQLSNSPASRRDFFGANLTQLHISSPNWPIYLIPLGLTALAFSWRVAGGIEPEPREPIDIVRGGAEITSLVSRQPRRNAS